MGAKTLSEQDVCILFHLGILQPRLLSVCDIPMKTCPTCHKPAQTPFAPFCSKRCADIDLNRWFTGHYAIPAAELDDLDDEDQAAMDSPPQ